MKNTVFLAPLFLLYSFSAHSMSPAICAPITKEQVEQKFELWNNALKTQDPDKVASLYEQNATLLPTVAAGPLTNREEIKEYFRAFLKKKPQGKINKRIITIDCNVASDIGTYTFTLSEKGKAVHIKARYTFIYTYENGQWAIAHHHSSAFPVHAEK